MPEIRNPTLSIEPIEGHPGRRLVRVDYDLVTAASDPFAERALSQRVELHAVDEHDAAWPPSRGPVAVFESSVDAAVGTHHQSVEWSVNRVDLDVEQDLWRNEPGGDPRPIAEWLDHVACEIHISYGDAAVAGGTTPTVTGSWGALGSD